MFMRVNPRCAHHVRPPRSGGLGDLDSDSCHRRVPRRAGVSRGRPSVYTGVQSLASRVGSNRGRATS
jgi:hypothetical protein